MNLLFLGGTRFVGRHMVDAALANGHAVTLFHRGRDGHDPFPQVENILGDRDGGLSALGDRTWDAVIDTCGYHPRVVRQSAEALKGKVAHYLFISTVSIYAEDNPRDKPVAEDARLKRFETEPESETITGETYGEFKVQCEEVINEVFAGDKTMVRPGLIGGPHDHTDRFSYWVDRFSRSGPVLVPGGEASKLQLIDARDLAAFTIKLVEDRTLGEFNAVAPVHAMPFDEMLHTIRMNTNGSAEPVTVDPDWLQEQGVKPWADLPLWIPGVDGGLHEFDSQRAIAAGLQTRSMAQTVRDIVGAGAGEGDGNLRTGLPRARELELVEAWRAR